MSWVDIADMVETESNAGNPIAGLIHKLKLADNKIVLRLRDVSVDSDSDDNSDDDCDVDCDDDEILMNKSTKKSIIRKVPFVLVDIELALSAYANSCKIHDSRKHAKFKELRTREASTRAIESVQESSDRALAKQNVQRQLRSMRKGSFYILGHYCIVFIH